MSRTPILPTGKENSEWAEGQEQTWGQALSKPWWEKKINFSRVYGGSVGEPRATMWAVGPGHPLPPDSRT